MQITQRHLEFLAEAKEAFNNDVRMETLISVEYDLIALRRGSGRDCVQIYEIGEQVGFFAQMIASSKRPVGEAYGR